MKIGIITVQRAPNFGAQLQCYALYSYLRGQGHDVEIIDLLRPFHSAYIKSNKYKPVQTLPIKKTLYRWLRSKVKRLISSDFRKNLEKERLFLQMHKSDFLRLNGKFASFESKMKYSRTYKSIEDLYDNPPSYDVYITGSDQLWNPSQPYCVEPYFLTFVKNGGIKMSYATSIGLSHLPKSIMEQYFRWLKDYTWISVREQTAVSLLSNEEVLHVERHIDPTFLIDVSEWNTMAVKPQIDDYLFYFSLNKNSHFLKTALNAARERNLKFVYWKQTWKQEAIGADSIGLIDISPEEWLGYIRNAKYIVTDSFHGTVFSILFKKNFNSFIPAGNRRGSRILDLLELFELDGRLINPNLSLIEFTSIDYETVFSIIEREKIKAFDYLSKIS